MEDPLYQDPALVRFYDLENGWAADTEFCRSLALEGRSVLDLGCGTGLLAACLAAEHGLRAVGVDPAAAMLEVARARPGGERTHWVEADARGLRLGEVFDLVVMTGHAFQVFLTEADRAAVLATVAAHLAPGGRFVFDSRNPAAREWEEWTPEASRRVAEHPELGRVEIWNDVNWDPAISVASYDSFYQMPDGGPVLAARSRIAFPDQAALSRQISEAGLGVTRWLGEWSGAPFQPDSPEIIPLGRRA